MNTIETNYYLSNCKQFKGTFPRDMLPKTLSRPGCVIINTDTAKEPGTHWVCVYLDKEGTAHYFDSFGLCPEFKEIREFLNRISTKWESNTICFQSIYSATCGMYCVYYLTCRCKGGDMDDFRSLFNQVPGINDRLAEMIYKLQK